MTDTAATTDETLRDRVRAVFSNVTRYPVEILEFDADLEEDLGIDSVKLAEIVAVLQEEYSLPEDVEIPREQLRSIRAVARALEDFLDGNAGEVTHDAVPTDIPIERLVDEVRSVFAEVTRYPLEILDPQAHLEEDLGIDSVKLAEIVAVLSERYGLPADAEETRETPTSIAEMAATLRILLAGSAPDASDVQLPGTNGNGTAAAAAEQTVPLRSTSSQPLAGKVVLVTGSGRGLGRDTAMHLAELGAEVIVNSFHSRDQGIATAAEIEEAGGKARHIWGSFANEKHIHAIFDEIEERHGGLDFLVGNASNGMLGRLEDITSEHWLTAVQTNLIGLHVSALRARTLMKQRGGGKIITLSSPAAHNYVDYFGLMGPIKAAVESLSRTMAIEFATDGIQVTCVSPGPIYGQLLDRWPERDRLISLWEKKTPGGTLCSARDVSQFIAYLLTEPVRFFSGAVVVMDGGMMATGP